MFSYEKFVYSQISINFATALVREGSNLSPERLKGNQVKVLNSPAAVSFTMSHTQHHSHWRAELLWEGSVRQKRVRRPAMHCFVIAFEEKAWSL